MNFVGKIGLSVIFFTKITIDGFLFLVSRLLVCLFVFASPQAGLPGLPTIYQSPISCIQSLFQLLFAAGTNKFV